MSRFRYEATDGRGRTQAGEVKATDQAGAADQLTDRGLTIVALRPVEVSPRGTDSPLTDRDVAELVEQLRALTRAGLPLPAGLRAAATEVESPPLRAAFARLADHLAAGRDLDAALIAESNRFPAHLQGIARAGARSGRLADVLAEVVRGSNLGQELRRRVAAAVAYPAAVLVVVVGLSLFICHVAVGIADGLTMPQEWTTPSPRAAAAAASTALARTIADHDLAIALGLAGAVAAGWAGWRFLLGPAARRRVLERIPLIGPLLRFTALAEFCHLAALLVEAETPLPEALDLAGASVRDAALARSCGLVAAEVAQGEPLVVALRAWDTLPAGLGQLLAWGDGGRGLAESLRFAGEMLETRAEAQATYASQVIAALLLLMIVWWLGFAVATIYLPTTSAIQMLSG